MSQIIGRQSCVKWIGLEPAWKLRNTAYIRGLLEFPPEGYRFAPVGKIEQTSWSAISKLPYVFSVQEELGEYFPLPLLKSLLDLTKRVPSKTALTYALDHLVFRNESWVLEMTFEPPSTLCGGEANLRKYTSVARRILSSARCKHIFCQTKVGLDAMVLEFGKEIQWKSSLVPPAGFPHYFPRKESDKTCLLFVNSSNINTYNSFYIKGGAEVIESFLLLRKSFDKIELILRSPVPDCYKQRLRGIKEVRLIEKPVTFNEMTKVWMSADILVQPHHTTMPYTIIDAMGYGLPVISSDAWGTPEIVRDGVTGLLVHDPLAAEYTTGPTIHLTKEFRKRLILGAQPEMVKGLVDSISRLIDNKSLANAMGDAGRLEVASGSLSIGKRNRAIKAVLDAEVC